MKTRWTLSAAFCLAAFGAIRAQSAAGGMFKPQKLADGVWAMMTKGGANTGWFLFGDGVVAVDSGSDTSAEGLLAAIAETTGGKKISYLIVTNNFGPHAGGAAAFAKRGAFVVSQEKFGPYLTKYLKPRAAASSEGPRILTLSQRIILSDSKRFVEIDFVGPADSGGDLVVYLPDEQILFTGDLVESAILPPLFSAELEPEGWVSALEKLEGLKIKELVPGYGPIGPPSAIKATRAYLQSAIIIAKKAIVDKVPDEFLRTRLQEPDVAIKDLPADLMGAHVKNIQALVQRLKSRAAEQASPAPAKK